MPTLNSEGLITLSDEKVKLQPYKPRPFRSISYMTDKEILDNAGSTLVFDVEVYHNYFLIAFKSPKLQKYLRLEIWNGKQFNERQLSWILHNYICVGFNGIKFDLPLIWLSYQDQSLEQLYELSKALIFENLWWQEAQVKYNFKIFPTPSIDLIEVAPLKGSLKLYGARLHCARLQELPFKPNIYLIEEQKEIIANYCFNDLDVTEALLIFMKERIELRKSMSDEYKINLMSKSDAQIAEAVINKEVAAINGAFPKRNLVKNGTKFYYKPPAYLQYQTKNLQELLEKIKTIEFEINNFGKVTLPDALKASVIVGNATYRLGIGGLHSSEECVSYVATAID